VWHNDDPTSGQSKVTNKATKSDDSKVPVHLWDRRIMAGFKHLRSKLGTAAQVATIITVVAAATILRRLKLRSWKINVKRDFVVWFPRTEHITDARKDI
jgi:type IV secretory pathway component VirB8